VEVSFLKVFLMPPIPETLSPAKEFGAKFSNSLKNQLSRQLMTSFWQMMIDFCNGMISF
jgi:hypothetical protein